jgi:tetratricopeptide (TPR) repeat protein
MLYEEMEFSYFSEAEQKARKAFELYEDGQMAQALDELDTAIELNPANSAWHFDKALALDAVSRFEEAIAEYEMALQLSPHDLEILNSLAIDYTRTGQYDLAIDTFEQIEQFDADFEPCYCNRIITYAEMDLHDLAEQMFYLAQQIKPDCALCYYNIGNSLFVRGLYKKAIACWHRTAELEPTHPQINYRIGQAYWSQDDCVHAHQHFLSELRNNPGDVDVILDFGLLLLETGDIESAKEKFNRIIELEPESASASFYLGEIALRGADSQQAVQMFTEAMRKDNTLTGPRYRLAQHALVSDDRQTAKEYLIAETKLCPDDADILVSMGSMFLALDEVDCATHCLLRAIDIDSANVDGYYYLGLACAADKRLEDAADFFGNALDIRPDDVRILRSSAVLCLAMGRLDTAAERIRHARALADDDAQAKNLAGKIRLAQAKKRVRDFLTCSRQRLKRLTSKS